jgi:hypothetical protein
MGQGVWASHLHRPLHVAPPPGRDIGASGAADSALQVSPLLHDFGAVGRLGGQVHTSFIVHNQGETPITIRRIWTS